MGGFLLGLSWLVTALAACVAAVSLFADMGAAQSAPQQAAAAAFAAALCVVPYVFTRAVEAMVALDAARKGRS